MRSDGTGEHQVTKTDDWHEGAPFFMQDDEHIIFRAWHDEDVGTKTPKPMIRKDGSNWRRHTFDRGMNWGRATGKGFGGIRTHVMDVSSLNIGPESAVPYDPTWGEAMSVD